MEKNVKYNDCGYCEKIEKLESIRSKISCNKIKKSIDEKVKHINKPISK